MQGYVAMLIYRLCGYAYSLCLYTGYVAMLIYRLFAMLIYRLYTGYVAMLIRYAYSLRLFATLIHRCRCHTRHHRFVHMI